MQHSSRILTGPAPDFEPAHVFELADWLYSDIGDFDVALPLGDYVSHGHPETGPFFDAIPVAMDRFTAIPGFQEFQERIYVIDEASFRSVIPGTRRRDFEDAARKVIHALRAYRDALGSVFRKKLNSTAVHLEPDHHPDHPTILLTADRLAVDLANLSASVASLDAADAYPAHLALLESAGRHLRTLNDSAERDVDRIVIQEGVRTVVRPTQSQLRRLEEMARVTISAFEDARKVVVASVEIKLALALHDYDPDWASPDSPVVLGFDSGQAIGTPESLAATT